MCSNDAFIRGENTDSTEFTITDILTKNKKQKTKSIMIARVALSRTLILFIL